MGVGRELMRFAGIGAKLAVRRAFGRDDGERFLLNTLNGMPGAPAKIGQLLGMRSAKSIPSPEPMPIEEVKAILFAECPALASSIESISDWSKTASIGQTHQARLSNGALVAIKIQYPGVAKALSDQIDAIFGVAGLSPARHYEFDVGQTKAFMRQKLLEETNYLLESDAQRRFAARYRLSAVIVPTVYPEFSTAKILTQSWEDSISLDAACRELSLDQRCKAGAVMTSLLFDSLMGIGLIHTDLNPGNYGFRLDGSEVKFVLYDYGSTYQLTSEQGLQIYQWVAATKSKNEASVRSALECMGFSSNRLAPIASKLLAMSEAMLAPLMTNQLWAARDWHLQERLDDVLGQDKWWFRTAGPPWFLYLMRTAQGWHHALSTLAATVQVSQIWWPWEQQLKSLADFMGSKPQDQISAPQKNGPDLRSKSLRVLVTEGAEEIVDMTLPARAVEDLEDLVPVEVGQRCALEGIHLRAISERVIAEGGSPQELFAADHGRRHYRVWLD